MKIKWIVLPASVALLLLALAAPGVAQAEWTHEGEPLGVETEVHLEGNLAYESALGSLECESVTAEIAAEPGSEGWLDVEPDIESCEGTGAFSGWFWTEIQKYKSPWPVKTNPQSQNMTASAVGITIIFCVPFFNVHFSNWQFTLTPDNPEAISTVDVSGEGIAEVEEVGEFPAEVSGTFHVTGGDAGTYGIGE